MAISRRAILAATLAFVLHPRLTTAQEESDSAPKSFQDMTPEERRTAYQAMSEEEKRALQEKRRAAYEAMSEEEKQALQEKRRAVMEERRAEWESLTAEEKQAKREEMRERMQNMTPEQRAAIRERRQRARMRDNDPAEADKQPAGPEPQ